MKRLLAVLFSMVVLVPAAFGQGIGISGGFQPSWSRSAGGSLTYTPTDLTQAWDGTGAGTFTGVNVGSVAADRIIVVTIATTSNSVSNGTPTSVTVGGVAMTLAASGTGAFGQAGLFVYYLAAPSGVLNASTATVQVNTPFSGSVVIVAGNLNGSAGASVNASNGNGWSGGGTVSDPRGVPNDLTGVAVATGGVVVTGWAIDRSGSYTANSSNTTVDTNAAGGIGAFVASHGTNGSPNFNGATNFNCNFVIASFKP